MLDMPGYDILKSMKSEISLARFRFFFSLVCFFSRFRTRCLQIFQLLTFQQCIHSKFQIGCRDAAFNDALSQAKRLEEEQMSSLTGGLGLPPGLF